jgi:hypothetical protein
VRKLLAFVAAVALALVAAIDCGPSFQAVYEGDVQFEHCYAVDESAHASLREKAECWRDWTKNYTYGQTRDRVEYAASRRDALFAVAQNPTDEMLMEGAPGGGFRKKVISAPSPTSVFAPPPNTMPEIEDAGAHDAELPRNVTQTGPRPPSWSCTDSCGQGWRSCQEGCDDAGAATSAGTCAACKDAYARCMTACFGADAGPPKKGQKPR